LPLITKVKIFKKKLKAFADKHYAHIEIRTQKQKNKEVNKLKVGWYELKDLITFAKDSLNTMCRYWNNHNANFEENNYDYFKEGFWSSIHPDYELIDGKWIAKFTMIDGKKHIIKICKYVD
jgi:hypothetical protein